MPRHLSREGPLVPDPDLGDANSKCRDRYAPIRHYGLDRQNRSAARHVHSARQQAVESRGSGFQYPGYLGDRLDRRAGLEERRRTVRVCAGGDSAGCSRPIHSGCARSEHDPASSCSERPRSIYHPTMPAQDQPGLGFQGKTIPDLAAPAAPPPSKGSYEARVMQGIWAAASYLHNGSVPTLAELLKPAAERVKQFKIGPAYDNVNIGLAVEQTQFDATITTTDCGDLNSGNSHCGHEFGTQLPDAEKKALLEYLKTL